LGFQKRVWWPKWTPASSISRIVTDMGVTPKVVSKIRPELRCSIWKPLFPDTANHNTFEWPVCDLLRQVGAERLFDVSATHPHNRLADVPGA
jgi:hypothetical protein